MKIQPGSGYDFKASSSGFSIEIEKGWVDYISTAAAGDNLHPFKVIFTSNAEEIFTYRVVTGAVNNSIPSNMDDTFDLIEAGSIWVACGYDATNKKFPDPTNIVLDSGPTLPDSTTSVAYVLLATVNDGAVNQIVTGSLWGDRIQIGSGETASAHYYFARV
jgi:hypothetical protein